MSITTAQIRGARGLLGWNQSDLSDRTGISTTSIGAIENGNTQARESTLVLIRRAFESEGIEFLGRDGIRQRQDFIRTYSGQDGFRSFMDHLYETAKTVGGEFVLFNAHPDNWQKWLGEEWFQMHSDRMRDLGDKISFRITSQKGTTNLISKGFAEYRWFTEELFQHRAMYAYDRYLAFVSFEKDDVSIIVLEQPHFAQAFRILFDIAWEAKAVPIGKQEDS